jgi:hypothetical protein
MADVARSERPARPKLSVAETWRLLNVEQRVAAVGALLLIVSTFGPFSFVEAGIVLIGAAVLFLLRKRAQGREFHIPFGDGAIIAAAGTWAGFLIVIRLFDRPLGQGLLALVCAAILMLAGLRERAKRPADDLPTERVPDEPPAAEPVADRSVYRDETIRLPASQPGSEEPSARPADERPKPAKVLPPPPREQDLEQPPLWEDPRGESGS